MKSIIGFAVGTVVGGGIVAVVGLLAAASNIEPVPVEPEPRAVASAGGAVRYNCELSDGVFEDGACVCPLENGQTQEMMYDEETGFCQTTYGGPGGAAFAASIGLPRGHYAFWNGIVFGLCAQSGGWVSGASCQCPDGTAYNPDQGLCVDRDELACFRSRYGLRAGETYDDGCNRHTCQEDGTLVSTEIACE